MNKSTKNMQKITPFLWFDGQAEDAAKFYTSIFKGLEDRQNPALRRGSSQSVSKWPAGRIGTDN
jgi:predicted 3-demethylubiquinone-9 3-methyltransferase (glyoxalase superfamily)